jgi:hypothetical protein
MLRTETKAFLIANLEIQWDDATKNILYFEHQLSLPEQHRVADMTTEEMEDALKTLRSIRMQLGKAKEELQK